MSVWQCGAVWLRVYGQWSMVKIIECALRAFTTAISAQSGWQFLFKNDQKSWLVRGNVFHVR